MPDHEGVWRLIDVRDVRVGVLSEQEPAESPGGALLEVLQQRGGELLQEKYAGRIPAPAKTTSKE
jgi:hypothetical protein